MGMPILGLLLLLYIFCITQSRILSSSVISNYLVQSTPPSKQICPHNVSWIRMSTSHKESCCLFHIQVDSYGWIQSSFLKSQYLSYQPGVVCEWILHFNESAVLELRVQFLRLIRDDKLYVYDKLESGYEMLAVYGRGSNDSWRLLETNRNIHVRFVSSPIGSDEASHSILEELYGFNITYQLQGVCIPELQRPCVANPMQCYDIEKEACDGIWHCKEDGSDEWNCTESCSGANVFYCPQLNDADALAFLSLPHWGDNTCYDLKQRCDGQPHCQRMEDELRCSSEQCGLHNGTWKCPHSGECIYIKYRCDGILGDCKDNGDEEGCDYPIVNGSNVALGDPFYSWRRCPSPSNVVVVVTALMGLALLVTILFHCLTHRQIRKLVAHNYELFQEFHVPLQPVGCELDRCTSSHDIYSSSLVNSRLALLAVDEDSASHANIPTVTAALSLPISLSHMSQPDTTVSGHNFCPPSPSSFPYSSQADLFCLGVSRVSGARA